jgi:phage-related protein
VKGAIPPEAYVPQKAKLLDTNNITLLTGDTLALDSAARKAAKNGENVISTVNPQFAVYGLPLVGGSNAIQCEAAEESGPYSLTTIFRKMYY